MIPKPGAIYVMNRGYFDFARLYVLHLIGAFFITRAKSNLDAHRVFSTATDRTAGIVCDQTIALDGFIAKKDYPHSATPHSLQRSRNQQNADIPDQQFHFAISNNLRTLQKSLAGRVVLQMDQAASSYQAFLMYIGEYRQITKIWIAVLVYVLGTIIIKQLNLNASLYTLIQTSSITLFEEFQYNKHLQLINTKTITQIFRTNWIYLIF